MTCCICDRAIAPADYQHAMCWSDPGGEVNVAHGACLARLGEYELDLDARP